MLQGNLNKSRANKQNTINYFCSKTSKVYRCIWRLIVLWMYQNALVCSISNSYLASLLPQSLTSLHLSLLCAVYKLFHKMMLLQALYNASQVHVFSVTGR